MGLTILITGAGGYLGRYTIAQARDRGHRVRAMVRRAGSIRPEWQGDGAIEAVVCDLAADDLVAALTDIDAVIHAAAAFTGDDAAHQVDTITATERLFAAIAAQRNPPRVVLVSSMSVYGGLATPADGIVDETTALEDRPGERDAYCRAKLAQEEMARASGLNSWILRVGALFGPGRLWNAHLGPRIGPVLFRIGRRGQVPLSFVRHAALAIVLAAERPVAGVEVVNVIDSDLPRRDHFQRALGAAGPRWILPLNYALVAALARLAAVLPRDKPGLLRPATLAARLRPLRYDNSRLATRLGWIPELDFAQAIEAAKEGADGC